MSQTVPTDNNRYLRRYMQAYTDLAYKIAKKRVEECKLCEGGCGNKTKDECHLLKQ